MHTAWTYLQTRPLHARWPAKWGLFLLVLLLTLYPSPAALIRHLSHLKNPNQMADPGEPTLGPVLERFDAYLAASKQRTDRPQDLLAHVERFVYREVPYAWDWDTWGVADYLPTVGEVIASGREDCDGRAVLAAAILKAKGVPAELVGDVRHMWVKAAAGETMSPMGQPVFRTKGGKTSIRWRGLVDLGPPAFGLAVFPFGREAVIVLVGWALLLPAGFRRGWALLGLVLMAEALMAVRLAGIDPMKPVYLGILWGLGNAAAAVAAMACSRPRAVVSGPVGLPSRSLLRADQQPGSHRLAPAGPAEADLGSRPTVGEREFSPAARRDRDADGLRDHAGIPD